MGKKLIIISFLASFILALFVYSQKDEGTIREGLEEEEDKEPRVILEDFIVYQYHNDKLTNHFTARLGHLFEPNIVELYGEISGIEYKKNGETETFGAESAVGYYNARTLSEMFEESELKRAEFSGFVEIEMGTNLLSTDFAEYLAEARLIRSDRPVRFEGPGRVFSGQEGFAYLIDNQTMKMNGPITGDVKSDGF